MNKILGTIFGIFCLSGQARAIEAAGVSFAEVQELEGHKLLLNGVGLREATIFSIRVYAAGLYLESKTQNPDEIMNSKQIRRVDMQFVRNVGADDVKGAWEKSFEKNCGKCETFQKPISEILSKMSEMKKGERMSFLFFPDSSLRMHIRGQEVLRQNVEGFSRIVLASWFGPSPPNESLKRGLLGVPKE